MKFGRLVVCADYVIKHNRKCYRTICDCGEERYNFLADLHAGRVKSCGCFRNEQSKERSTKHGHANVKQQTKTYNCYNGMKDRCYNPDSNMYHRYGGRGIKVCDRWLESFENFLADMGEAPNNHSIDRIDNNGNYEPDNCRWSTNFDQSRNRSTNIFVDYEGETMILKDFAIKAGVRNYRYLCKLMKHKNMSHIEAVAFINRPNKRKSRKNNETGSDGR